MKYRFKKTMYSSGKKKISFFKDIKKSRVWIPLVAIALAVVLLVTLLILILRDGSRVVLTEVELPTSRCLSPLTGIKYCR